LQKTAINAPVGGDAAAAASIRHPSAYGRELARFAEDGFGVVETLIALLILVFGILGVLSLGITAMRETRLAGWRSGQALAAQQVLETAHATRGPTATGRITVSIGGRDYAVTTTTRVTVPGVEEVSASVSGIGALRPRVFTTRIFRPAGATPAP